MSKTKAQLEAENEALRALVAAIGELIIPPALEDRYLATRIIKSICEEVDKYPELLDRLAADLRERATGVIDYLTPEAAVITETAGTGAPVIVFRDENDPVAALLADGYTIRFLPDEVVFGWVAELRRPDGTLAENGTGNTQEEALRHLRERLATQGCPS